ncbi:uncharacterized protein TNCV_3713891 [Trichonephila clavipes]|nr:uncharacterized protein TNCV_3713891 [Trichonephila clavipes]
MHANERLMIQLPPRWIFFPKQQNNSTSNVIGLSIDEVDIRQFNARMTIHMSETHNRKLSVSEIRKPHVLNSCARTHHHLLLSDDSDEDITLSESDCKESEENTDIIDYIPVDADIYISRDSTEWIPRNSNVPGRFVTRNVLRQSSGSTSFAKNNVNVSFL